MIDGSKKRNRQLAFELQNSHVYEKRSNDSNSVAVRRYNVDASSVRHQHARDDGNRVGEEFAFSLPIVHQALTIFVIDTSGSRGEQEQFFSFL